MRGRYATNGAQVCLETLRLILEAEKCQSSCRQTANKTSVLFVAVSSRESKAEGAYYDGLVIMREI